MIFFMGWIKSTTINRSHVIILYPPYRKVSAFKISDQIDALICMKAGWIVAAKQYLCV